MLTSWAISDFSIFKFKLINGRDAPQTPLVSSETLTPCDDRLGQNASDPSSPRLRQTSY